MFKFLKNLFKEEQEKQEISFKELENWFKEKTEPTINELNLNIKLNLEKIKTNTSELKENILNLENAEIKDPKKVEDKTKNVVLSHRTNYIKLLNNFIKSITIPELDYKLPLVFCSSIESELDQLGKVSTKSHFTTQHLFSDEVGAIAKSIKSIDISIKQIKQEIEDKNIIDIQRVEKKIEHLKDSIKNKQEFEEKLDDKKDILNQTQENITNLEKQEKDLEQSSEFLRLKHEKQKLSETEDNLSRNKGKVIELFSSLESSLKKFQRITIEHEDLVEKYAKDSMNALLNDKELKILGLLGNMKKNIESGALDLKDKKKDKAIEHINEIKKDVLESILNEYDSLNNQKKEIEEKIKANRIDSKFKDIKHKAEHYLQKKQAFEKEISTLESNKEKIDLEEIKNNLRELIIKAINIDVTISFS